MNLALVLVFAAAISFVVIVLVGRSRLQFANATEIQPIDVDAFRNLADLRESEYLRSRLPSAEFRHIQRLRLRALAAYVQAVGQNAVMLIRIGQSALNSNQTEIVQAARKLVNEALLLRRNAGLAMLRIYLALLWPNAGFAAAPVLESYQRLSGSAMLLSRLQNPAATVRISA
jgi:predicted anti-sigma-YlaC factor YlaD